MTTPSPVTPQPGPFTLQVQYGTLSTGEPVVIVTAFTVTGTTTLFLSPDQAESMATDLTRGAKAARTGLILPGPGRAPQVRR